MNVFVRIMEKATSVISKGINYVDWMNGDEDIEFKNGETLPYTDYRYFAEDYSEILMATGKRDNKGKRVFEFDICDFAYRHLGEDAFDSGTVFWSDKDFAFCVSSKRGRLLLRDVDIIKVTGVDAPAILKYKRK